MEVFRRFYVLLCPFLAPLLLLTTIVFVGLTVYRGEIILGLQAELVKDKNKTINVIVKQQEIATEIGDNYERDSKVIETNHTNTIKEYTKIEYVPVLGECFSASGVQLYNDFASSSNSPE